MIRHASFRHADASAILPPPLRRCLFAAVSFTLLDLRSDAAADAAAAAAIS